MSVEAPPRGITIWWWNLLYDFVERVNRAWQQDPFIVTSWWRSPQANQQAGGAQFSQHLVGTAVDAVPRAGTRLQLKDHFERQGLICVVYKGHVHAQLLQKGVLERWLTGG